ncbi:MAG: pitrilysin family protein [Candidatus Aceula meridiana]|nr:pitrilysin family protein [Candidatus Aceula meridiana]
MYKRTELSNKLRIVSHQMKERSSVAVGVWTGVGGRYENVKNKGAAHFLEHIVFKGTKHYGCAAIKEQIEGVGGSLNAFTSEECTCYYAKVPSRHAEKTFDILSDLVSVPNITEKDVNKERGVILEEIKMYHDLPQHLVRDLLDQLLWPNHPLGQNIAGTIGSVEGMSYKDLRSFHNQFYIPSNIVVTACGDITHSKILNLSKKKFSKFLKDGPIDYDKAVQNQKKPQLRIMKKDIEQMHLALGVHGPHREHKDRYAAGILNVILGGNMSSRLFNEVREKRGLAYSIGSGIKMLQDAGAFIVRAGVDNTKIVDAVDVILKELKKIAQATAGAGEFKRAKDYLLGQMLLGLEDTAEHMFWMGESVVSTNKTETPQNVIKKVKKVTPQDVRRVAQSLFASNAINLSLVGPIKDAQEKEIRRLVGV